MALLFMDGFEAYSSTTQMALRWTLAESNGLNTPGRYDYGTYLNCGGSGTTPQKILSSSYATMIVGFGYRRVSNLNGGSIIALLDTATFHITLNRVASTGQLEVRRGNASGTVVATSGSDKTISVDVWYHIEIKATIADSGGSVIVKVNGVEWMNFTGDTRNGGNASVNGIQLYNSANSGGNNYDDVYMLDTSGSYNNDFLGDVRVMTLVPNASGTHSDFTPLAGNNYTNVNEAVNDGDTSYNSGSAPDQIDTYGITNIGSNATIKGVVNNLITRKDDAGTREIASVVRSGSTDYTGTTVAVASSYAAHSQIYETDPNTSSPWTLSNLNSAEFGLKVIT